MKTFLAIAAAGLFAASVTASAMACSGHVATTKSGAITTALDTHPMTPKPKPGS